MEEVNKDEMCYERKLLEIFGLRYSEDKINDSWLILDEANNIVGSTKLGLNESNKKGSLPPYFYTKIVTEKIIYENIRIITEDNLQTNYTFKIKNKNGQFELVSLNLVEFPYLAVFSTNYGINKFRIQNDKLLLELNRELGNYIVNEKIAINLKKGEEKYKSTTTFLSDTNYHNKRRVTFESIIEKKVPQMIEINQLVKENDSIICQGFASNYLEQSLENSIFQYGEYQLLLTNFIEYINDLIPFSSQIFKNLIANANIEEKFLELLKPEKSQKKFVKNTNN